MPGVTPANGRIDVFNVTVIRAIMCRTFVCVVTSTSVVPNPSGASTTMYPNVSAVNITLYTADPGGNSITVSVRSRVVSPLTAAHGVIVLCPGTFIL